MSGTSPYLTDMMACVLKLNHASFAWSLLFRTRLDHLYPLSTMYCNIGSPSPLGLTSTPSTLEGSVGSFSVISTSLPFGWGIVRWLSSRWRFEMRLASPLSNLY